MIRKPLPIKKATPAPKPLERWNLLGVGALAEALPPVPWVCEPLGLAPGAVSLVAGYGYSRKTMALQSLGLSIAAGMPAWGVWRVRSGPFVHLDYEQGRRLTQERYQRLARGMGFDIRDLSEGALCVACMPRAYLDERDVFDELVQVVGDATFVLTDSLRAAFPHADENSSEVRAHLDLLSRVSERTGATVAVIHHARKPNAANGGGMTHAIRGSSSLFDACQSVYVFEGEKDSPTRVHHQKDRIRGMTLDEFGLTSEDVRGPNGEARWGLIVRHLEGEQLAGAETAKVRAKEDVEIERAAEQIVMAIIERGGAVRAARRDVRGFVRMKREIFELAWNKLIDGGVLSNTGSYREPVWAV